MTLLLEENNTQWNIIYSIIILFLVMELHSIQSEKPYVSISGNEVILSIFWIF